MRLRAAVCAAAVTLALAAGAAPAASAGRPRTADRTAVSLPTPTLDATAATVAPTSLPRCTPRKLRHLAKGHERRCSLTPQRVRRCVRRATTPRGKRLCRAARRPSTTTTVTVRVPPTATDPETTQTTSGTATGGSTAYSFLGANADGSPARWNPCVPITWRFNPAGAPANGLVDVSAAMQRVSAAAGLPFSYQGTTTDRPFRSGPDHPGGEDLLLGFGDATDYPDMLTGPTIGYGGPYGRWLIVGGTPTPKEYVAGDVLLDSDNGLAPGFGPGLTFGNLVLHEVGHAIGLGHVDAPGEIMNPATTSASPNGYGPGDLAGLARLGRAAGCFATPLR